MSYKKLSFLLVLVVLLFLESSLDNLAFSTREIHQVKVIDLMIPKDSLECSKEISALVTISNDGTVDENILIELISPSLNINEFSPLLKVEDGKLFSYMFEIYLTNEISGNKEFEVRVHFNNNKQSTRFFKNFQFYECPKISAEEFKNQELAKNSILSKAQNSRKQLSFSMILTLSLIIAVFLLIIAYLIITYYEL